MMTLREWQQAAKSRTSVIFSCSPKDGSDSWLPFPIGIACYFNNYSGTLVSAQIGTHENTLLCAIKTSTDALRRRVGINRRIIAETLGRNGIPNTLVGRNEYFQTLPTYKFVISPEGNGVDCHRHCEALMAGCIPIIERHPGIEEKYEGCPILWTTDYSEITEDYLNLVYADMLDKEYNFSKLNVFTYPQEIQEQIRSNGNYWGTFRTGIAWYDYP